MLSTQETVTAFDNRRLYDVLVYRPSSQKIKSTPTFLLLFGPVWVRLWSLSDEVYKCAESLLTPYLRLCVFILASLQCMLCQVTWLDINGPD